MGKQTLIDIFREWIAGIAFSVYLWAVQMTKEQFWKAQEMDAIRQIKDDGSLDKHYYCQCPSCAASGLITLFLRER